MIDFLESTTQQSEMGWNQESSRIDFVDQELEDSSNFLDGQWEEDVPLKAEGSRGEPKVEGIDTVTDRQDLLSLADIAQEDGAKCVPLEKVVLATWCNRVLCNEDVDEEDQPSSGQTLSTARQGAVSELGLTGLSATLAPGTALKSSQSQMSMTHLLGNIH